MGCQNAKPQKFDRNRQQCNRKFPGTNSTYSNRDPDAAQADKINANDTLNQFQNKDCENGLDREKRCTLDGANELNIDQSKGDLDCNAGIPKKVLKKRFSFMKAKKRNPTPPDKISQNGSDNEANQKDKKQDNSQLHHRSNEDVTAPSKTKRLLRNNQNLHNKTKIKLPLVKQSYITRMFCLPQDPKFRENKEKVFKIHLKRCD